MCFKSIQDGGILWLHVINVQNKRANIFIKEGMGVLFGKMTL